VNINLTESFQAFTRVKRIRDTKIIFQEEEEEEEDGEKNRQIIKCISLEEMSRSMPKRRI